MSVVPSGRLLQKKAGFLSFLTEDVFKDTIEGITGGSLGVGEAARLVNARGSAIFFLIAMHLLKLQIPLELEM